MEHGESLAKWSKQFSELRSFALEQCIHIHGAQSSQVAAFKEKFVPVDSVVRSPRALATSPSILSRSPSQTRGESSPSDYPLKRLSSRQILH